MQLGRALLAPWLVLAAFSLSGAFWNSTSFCAKGQDALSRANPSPDAPAVNPIDCLRPVWNSEAAIDWSVTEMLASVSELSYLAPVHAERKFQALGFQRVRPFQFKSLSGYVVSEDDVAVIAFRG